jgi:hypothetical protein
LDDNRGRQPCSNGLILTSSSWGRMHETGYGVYAGGYVCEGAWGRHVRCMCVWPSMAGDSAPHPQAPDASHAAGHQQRRDVRRRRCSAASAVAALLLLLLLLLLLPTRTVPTLATEQPPAITGCDTASSHSHPIPSLSPFIPLPFRWDCCYITSSHRLRPMVHCPLPTAHCPLPTAHHRPLPRPPIAGLDAQLKSLTHANYEAHRRLSFALFLFFGSDVRAQPQRSCN